MKTLKSPKEKAVTPQGGRKMENKETKEFTDEEVRLIAEESVKFIMKSIKATNRYIKDLSNKLVEMEIEKWKDF